MTPLLVLSERGRLRANAESVASCQEIRMVEVWSRSTGGYDVNAKLPVYMERGDLEIWRIHPYERSLTSWVRQPDGSYQESVYRGGIVSLAALPGVTIDLDELFDV